MAQTAKAVMVQDGDEGIDYTPVGALNAGDVVDLGTCVGVTTHPIAAGELGALMLDGVFEFLKGTGQSVALWGPVSWDVSGQVARPTIGYDATIGICVKAAATGDATVRVKLIPSVS